MKPPLIMVTPITIGPAKTHYTSTAPIAIGPTIKASLLIAYWLLTHSNHSSLWPYDSYVRWWTIWRVMFRRARACGIYHGLDYVARLYPLIWEWTPLKKIKKKLFHPSPNGWMWARHIDKPVVLPWTRPRGRMTSPFLGGWDLKKKIVTSTPKWWTIHMKSNVQTSSSPWYLPRTRLRGVSISTHLGVNPT